MPPLDRGREALIKKVLADPDFYPPEFKAWVPRQIENNPTLKFTIDQLPSVEAVRFVRLPADPDNGQPAFQNSWVNYSVPAFQACGFWKDPWGTVHLQGLVKDGAVAVSTIFTLPGGYRPQNPCLFSTIANSAVGRIDVGSNGAVQLAFGSTVWVSLEGLSWRAYS